MFKGISGVIKGDNDQGRMRGKRVGNGPSKNLCWTLDYVSNFSSLNRPQILASFGCMKSYERFETEVQGVFMCICSGFLRAILSACFVIFFGCCRSSAWEVELAPECSEAD